MLLQERHMRAHFQTNNLQFRFFTLIELLIVISIIAVLAALLLPALSRAKQTAISSKCISNLKQIGVGGTLYSQDYNGFIPLIEGHYGGVWYSAHWYGSVYPYIYPGKDLSHAKNGRKTILVCDADQEIYSPGSGILISYGGNTNVGGAASPEANYFRFNNFSNISKVLWMMDIENSYWTNQWRATSPTSDQGASPRHSGRVNVLYLDAHCKGRRFLDMPNSSDNQSWGVH